MYIPGFNYDGNSWLSSCALCVAYRTSLAFLHAKIGRGLRDLAGGVHTLVVVPFWLGIGTYSPEPHSSWAQIFPNRAANPPPVYIHVYFQLHPAPSV